MITTQPDTSRVRLKLGKVQLQLEKRTIILVIVLTIVIVLLSLVSLSTGTIQLSVQQVLSALLGTSDNRTELVIWGIRLPRLVAALIVGSALGAAGAVFQSVSRNALGSPDVIGFTTGAATGAVTQIVFFNLGPIATSLAAICSGILTALIVYVLARNHGRSGGYRLVLIGIGVSAMLSAANSLILAKGNFDLAIKAQLWLSGSLNAREWIDIYPALVGLFIFLPILVFAARKLDILEMGDDQAQQLGIQIEVQRFTVMFAGVALTAVSVATAGPIAFIALAGPQITRRLTRGGRVQVLSSALFGASLLLSADVFSQNIPVGFALPVGLTTGLIGGMYLLWILTKENV